MKKLFFLIILALCFSKALQAQEIDEGSMKNAA